MQFLRPYGMLLRTLEIVYYLSPVLGLLGTVIGMIISLAKKWCLTGR